MSDFDSSWGLRARHGVPTWIAKDAAGTSRVAVHRAMKQAVSYARLPRNVQVHMGAMCYGPRNSG